MASSDDVTDYEEILKELLKKDGSLTQNIENEKNIKDNKRWETLQVYHETKGLFEIAESNNDIKKALHYAKSKLRNNVVQEHALADQELQQLLRTREEINRRTQVEIDAFYHQMGEHYQKFKQLRNENDNKKMKESIINLRQSNYDLQQEKTIAEYKLQVIKEKVENFHPGPDFATSKVLMDVIDKTSLDECTNTRKLECRLSEVRRSTEMLRTKINNLKVKYGLEK